jgi:glycosyltransferase involved in cell wall biosynthesis
LTTAKTFVIIPAFNEQSTILPVVNALLLKGWEVVVVDDGSALPLAPLLKETPVHYLRHRINLGQGAALQSGIRYALKKEAHYLVTFDADGQHRPEDVEHLLQKLQQENLDVVLGSRFLTPSQVPFNRKVVLQFARFVNFLFTGLFLSDAHNGLRAMNREAASCIHLKENRMAHATEILWQIKTHRLKVKEAPVTIHYTDYARSKGQTNWNSFRILFDLILAKFFK